jgi:hypothetical protein
VLFSVWGDVFLRKGGSVSWLNTGTGELSEVASSDDAFRDALSSGQVDDWFMPALVAALYRAGKRPGEGQCFSYTIFPIFAEGRYDADNIWVAPTKEHFGLSGDLHRQISALPDGGKVQMVIGQEPP